jgi:hypothetical protein
MQTPYKVCFVLFINFFFLPSKLLIIDLNSCANAQKELIIEICNQLWIQ